MKSISAWFDRHMKTRIALQLVMTGMPLAFLVITALTFFGMEEMPEELSKFCLFGFIFLNTPIFILSWLLRRYAEIDFKRFPRCETPFVAMEILEGLVFSLSVPFAIFFCAALIGFS